MDIRAIFPIVTILNINCQLELYLRLNGGVLEAKGTYPLCFSWLERAFRGKTDSLYIIYGCIWEF